MRQKSYLFGILIILAIFLAACNVSVSTNGGNGGLSTSNGSSSSSSGNSSSSTNNTSTADFGHPTKTSNCHVQGPLQDQQCTPGAIISSATTSQICTPGYAKSVRNVPISEKNQAYAEYNITHHRTGQYEVDHLVSLELGGSNDISNLWPEAASPKPSFHEKDKVENYLHDQVCSGKISLRTAQNEIATNWLNVYQHMPKGSYSSSNYYDS